MPPRRRASYPPEFRQRLVDLVRAGRTPAKLAKEFGPRADTIRRWEMRSDRAASGAGGGERAEGRFDWPEELALLGTLADAKVAEILGVSASTVRYMRRKLGIPGYHPPQPAIELPPEALPLLGKVSDREIGQRYQLPNHWIRKRRRQLGIPAISDSRRVIPTAELAELLRFPTMEAARRTGLSTVTVAKLRKQLGKLGTSAASLSRRRQA